MVATREVWEASSTLPRGASYEQMLEFFGIPPYSADRLNDNIGKKRRAWNHKTNSGNPTGRAKARDVVELIQRVAEALKRGVPDEGGGGAQAEIPDAVFQTLEELWRIVSEHVFADEYDEALQVAREAARRWTSDPAGSADAASVRAWVVATGFNNGGLAHPSLLAEGLEAAEIAVRRQPGVARNWESQASLLLASSRAQDALATVEQAERSIDGPITAMLYLLRCRGTIALDRAEEAMVAAVHAVNAALADPAVVTAVRSEATDLLVTWLAIRMLPIKSPAGLASYVEMVNVAAWCSYGVPEAEDQVRVHRMWAANAGKRVFVGSWRLRSFLAVCTGFISLPIHNYVRSSPAWKVFADGIGKDKHDVAFAFVASPEYVQRAHNVKLAIMLDLD
jgi:hypothetical protein